MKNEHNYYCEGLQSFTILHFVKIFIDRGAARSMRISVVRGKEDKKLFFSGPNPGVRRFIRRMAKPPAGRWDECAEKNAARGLSGGQPLIEIRSGL